MRKRGLFTRRIDGGDESSEAINLTPLIDMVFILLIFFLVTTSFIRESTVAVQRPKAATAVPQTNAAVIVTITADEQIWLNDVSVDIRLLRARLDQLGLANPAQAAIILADVQASTGLLVKVMDQLRLAGFVNISVAASSAPDIP
ncbi:biopolymer ExbD/TolR family transporter [Methylocaldum marinum]|uniref:Biopolymer ExbD/TolR family transporter n=1 Tax=Methylocaldum marinum TaxID=1432792 RepID=A0A250KW30_9GAMM|nr:biopolymer transporter ExbD [Methylocaldum marinum]BBA35827.1 biopolymer ExbD/TolR family transporter [Methylocaldum marinum]